MDIKEIVLRVAKKMRAESEWDVIDLVCNSENFAEALVAELAKQNEPKKVKLEAWIDEDGLLMHKANFGEGYVARGSWVRIPELDREITLPEGK